MGVYLNPGVTGGYIKNCTFIMGEDSHVAIGIHGLAGEFEISGNTFVGTGDVGADVELFLDGDYSDGENFLTVSGATVDTTELNMP